jgi:hypothetical protein
MDEDVVGLEHAVRFQLAAPVAVRMLQAEQAILRALYAFNNMLQAEIDPPKTRLRWLFYDLRIT